MFHTEPVQCSVKRLPTYGACSKEHTKNESSSSPMTLDLPADSSDSSLPPRSSSRLDYLPEPWVATVDLSSSSRALWLLLTMPTTTPGACQGPLSAVNLCITYGTWEVAMHHDS
ncbi:uncharacterized protein TrAtP1_007498 [Trichoderma atroviride]|uniref:uncharacterized protein n=1 Tax=Hypocrea atroviridis TaxID=63577 RepID=UPI00332E8751|nr:hypothetical protein TrAtP1_007498 [Trichoderma atroviride]